MSPDEIAIQPHQVAERAILSRCLLLGADAVGDALEVLGPSAEVFSAPRHQAIWKAMTSLADRGESIDEVQVLVELGRKGMVSAVGGKTALDELLGELKTSGDPRALPEHAQAVVVAAARRRLLVAAEAIARVARQPDLDRDQLRGQAEARLLEALASGSPPGRVGTMAEALDDMLKHMGAVRRGEIDPGLPTGIDSLDELVALRPGEISGIAARPSNGKTTLAMAIAQSLAKRSEQVGFVSLEMDRRDLAYNATASHSGIDGARIRGVMGLTKAEERTIVDSVEALATRPILIDDGEAGSLASVMTRMRSMVRRFGCKVVVLDYLQLIDTGPDPKARYAVISAASTQLKKLAREAKVHVMVCLQLNRQSESRGKEARPQPSDLRDSGQIEQDLDLLLLLHRPASNDDDYHDRRELQVKVAKQRNGARGTVKLTWRADLFRFGTYERMDCEACASDEACRCSCSSCMGKRAAKKRAAAAAAKPKKGAKTGPGDSH